jgi:hypothetical protein
MSFFPIIITKDILVRNVALINFVGRIVIIVARGRMGATKCTALTLEEKCDDLVSVAGGG